MADEGAYDEGYYEEGYYEEGYEEGYDEGYYEEGSGQYSPANLPPGVDLVCIFLFYVFIVWKILFLLN